MLVVGAAPAWASRDATNPAKRTKRVGRRASGDHVRTMPPGARVPLHRDYTRLGRFRTKPTVSQRSAGASEIGPVRRAYNRAHRVFQIATTSVALTALGYFCVRIVAGLFGSEPGPYDMPAMHTFTISGAAAVTALQTEPKQ